MYPVEFEYLQPSNLQEAVKLLQQRGEDARILAGGQSLIPLMKLRLARPRYLIDLNGVSGLNYIKKENGHLLIGALTRHAEIEASSLVRQEVPLMHEAVRVLGDLQVRNLGTLGGAIAEADPAGDWGPVILALNAKIRCVGPGRERDVEARDFFTFAYSTALQTGELVREIAVPLPRQPNLGTYMKLELVAGDFAVAGAALQADIDKDGICADIGIGLSGAGECPMKASSVETMLRGQKLTSAMIERAGWKVQEVSNPIADLRGSPAYKKEVLKIVFCRALKHLVEMRAQVST